MAEEIDKNAVNTEFPEIEEKQFDVILVGTGFIESVLAG